MFDSRDYLFLTNYLNDGKQNRKQLLFRNNAFRAVKLLLMSSQRINLELKQEDSINDLKDYQKNQFSEDAKDKRKLYGIFLQIALIVL